MDDCEGLEALSFKALLAEGKAKEESFGLEVGNAEELERGSEGIRIEDMEETAIEMELGLPLSFSLRVKKKGSALLTLPVDCRIIQNIFIFLFLFLSWFVVWAV